MTCRNLQCLNWASQISCLLNKKKTENIPPGLSSQIVQSCFQRWYHDEVSNSFSNFHLINSDDEGEEEAEDEEGDGEDDDTEEEEEDEQNCINGLKDEGNGDGSPAKVR